MLLYFSSLLLWTGYRIWRSHAEGIFSCMVRVPTYYAKMHEAIINRCKYCGGSGRSIDVQALVNHVLI